MSFVDSAVNNPGVFFAGCFFGSFLGGLVGSVYSAFLRSRRLQDEVDKARRSAFGD